MRLRRLGISGHIDLRSAGATALITVLAVGVACWSLTVGTLPIGVPDIVAALAGEADAATTRVVVEWRLPRVLFALLGGIALAVSGAVFQSVTRNPLGSPDVIGFSTGAYTGALLAGLLLGTTALGTSLGALVGGIGTGIVVYLLSYRRGVSGLRVIVIGIGVSVFLGAGNTYILTTLRLEQAISAASWGAGDLSDIGWANTVPVVIGIAIAVPVAVALGADMRMLEMGDDAGRGLGVRAELVRVLLLLLGVALIAVVTASAGPIAFVALAAPQLAKRLSGATGVRVLPSAALGALLLVTSDLIARIVIAPAQLPVGVVTLCLGGGYLVWLLAASGRRSRG